MKVLTGDCKIAEQFISIASIDQVVHDVDALKFAANGWRCVFILEAVQSASLLQWLSMRSLALEWGVMAGELVRKNAGCHCGKLCSVECLQS